MIVVTQPQGEEVLAYSFREFPSASAAIASLGMGVFSSCPTFDTRNQAFESLCKQYDAGLPPHLTRLDGTYWHPKVKPNPSFIRQGTVSATEFDALVRQALLKSRQVTLASAYDARGFCSRNPDYTQKTKNPDTIYFNPKLKAQRKARREAKQQAIYDSGIVPSHILASIVFELDQHKEIPSRLNKYPFVEVKEVDRSENNTKSSGWGYRGISESDAFRSCLYSLKTLTEWHKHGLRYNTGSILNVLEGVQPYLNGLITDEKGSLEHIAGTFLKKMLADARKRTRIQARKAAEREAFLRAEQESTPETTEAVEAV